MPWLPGNRFDSITAFPLRQLVAALDQGHLNGIA